MVDEIRSTTYVTFILGYTYIKTGGVNNLYDTLAKF